MDRPIGIFDSGVGGLSVVRQVRTLMPAESILYVADHAFSPYGERSQESVTERSEKISAYLYEQGCKAIVVACNTATVSSISQLRDRYRIPIVGVEPGIKPAAEATKVGVIGVLATGQTLKSDAFRLLSQRVATDIRVEVQPCPAFVELVETGDFNSDHARRVVQGYLQPLLDKGVDQLVLGCTHFVFLRHLIEEFTRGWVEIIDTASAVAVELKRQLALHGIKNHSQQNSGELRLLSSLPFSGLDQQVGRLLGLPESQGFNIGAISI